ncbi:MAG: hypothetical protein RLZZ546_119 [Bacteroidota bacterium]|jgi:rfaE bifunctional protein nucleotidyltransferase chain/domain
MIQINNKIINTDKLYQISQWKKNGQRLCFTNGCFDLVHAGHVTYLHQASSLADKLIVAINSDESVKRLKGKHRPIINQQDRALLLAAFYFIDAVIIFEEDTPMNLIQLILPDVLVKGGDWTPDKIIGSDVVLAHGGEVLSLPYLEGHSTTNIEKQIIDNYLQKENS